MNAGDERLLPGGSAMLAAWHQVMVDLRMSYDHRPRS